MSSVLLIFAHPDDESFYAAGTIARCSGSGVRVGIVCATRGERGSTADLCSIEELPRVREAELQEAAKRLGVESGDVSIFDYEDQKLWTAPPDEIRALLVENIRRLRPDIVITFDPHGSNQHTDHISIARFATDAIAAAADPRWYPEAGPAHTTERVLWTAPLHVYELGSVRDVARQAGIDYLIDISAYRAAKEGALSTHRTQWPGLRRVFLVNRDPVEALKYEAFRVASGPRPDPSPAAWLF